MSNQSSKSTGARSHDNVVSEIFRLFCDRGDAMYAGEPISQTEHALQAASLAEKESAGSALIAAALLHDIGHLLSPHPEDCAESGIDDQHEQLGAKWLDAHLDPEVVGPVRLHVPAKRYLCAVDPAYLHNLSAASVTSLALQGGPFTTQEVKTFEALPHAKQAVRLRMWDDAAKVAGLKVADVPHYRPHIEACLNS